MKAILSCFLVFWRGLGADSTHTSSQRKRELFELLGLALLVQIARSNYWCSCERACEWLCNAARF